MNLVRGGRASRWLAGLLWMCVFASAAFGDGKVFSGRPEPLAVPDQEAILCFRNGIETLAIRTRVDVRQPGATSAATPMAWVVPVPGPVAPTLGTTTDGTFVSAGRLLSTRLLDQTSDEGSSAALIFGISALVAVLGLRAAKGGPTGPIKRIVVLTVYLGFFVLFATCMTLPTLSKSRSSPDGVAGGVRVLATERVGTLDVAVLQAAGDATSAAALRAWLTHQGCVVPADADTVIQAYATAGWVFVAARLSEEALAGRLQPTPLVLTFKTDKPVYPMRLTGVGNGPLALSLFVFGEGTAAVDGMTVEQSDGVFELTGELHTRERWTHPFVHEGLLKLFMSAADKDGFGWGTRLSGTLAPTQQTKDMRIAITPGVSSRRELYTPRGAAGVGTSVGSLVLGLMLLVLSAWGLLMTSTPRWIITRAAVLLGVACLAGFVAAKSLPTAPGEFRYTKPAYRREETLKAEIVAAAPRTEAEARSWIAAKRAAGDKPWSDLSDEYDGPDGWRLRTDEHGVLWFEIYDYRGGISESEPLSLAARKAKPR